MAKLRRAEAIGYARAANPDNPREISGILVPYGAISNLTRDLDGAVIRETIRPAAARSSVEYWMTRPDGARMPYRPRHGERPVGAFTWLGDTPEGVEFRASILETPRGDEYLAEVAAGLNGVSAEFADGDTAPTRNRDGIVVQRSIKLMGGAGSDAPAYDGARIALRDMDTTEETAEMPETTPVEPAELEITPAERQAAETAAAKSPVVAQRSAIVITRAEPVYRPQGEHNYFRDTWLASPFNNDTDARERQRRHKAGLQEIAEVMEREAAARYLDPAYAERAGDLLSSEIPGAYPTEFVPGLLTPRIFKGRPMGDFYQRYPIASAIPRTFAKVTTSTAVAVQSAEGAALSTTDLATTAVTVTPSMYGATIDVSRQVLDGADPSALSFLFQDLLEAYAQQSESVIKTAVEAGSTASGVAITAATPYAGTLANVINYYAVRFRGATGAFIPSALFPVLAAQGDTTGRPFLPMIGAVNSDGTTLADDTTLALGVLTANTKLSYQSTVNVCVFARPTDFVIYESPITTVQYEQVVGPQAVRVGLWAYLGIGTRLGSLKVTAA